MPQLNIETWPPQLIWLAISFLTLFFIMRFVALPRVGGVIERRQKQVNDDLAAAQRFKAATEKAIADYEAALAEARAKGNAIAQAAREKLARETEQERAKVAGELSERVAAAEKAIAQSKTKAMADIEKVAADLAAEIVTELAGITASSQGAAKSAGARAPSKTDAE
jgi:F-type H+-transporting ATPase subunit b